MTHNQPPGWTGPPNWDSPPTEQFSPVPPAPPQRRGPTTALIVSLVLGSVLLLGLLIAGAIVLAPRLTDTPAVPTTSTVSATVTAPAAPDAQPTAQPVQPAQGNRLAGAYECMSRGAGQYTAVAVGSSVTSCEFAQVVWSQYVLAGGSGQSMTVNAYSPVTGQSYAMSCVGGSVVTCTGGSNAVVHIY